MATEDPSAPNPGPETPSRHFIQQIIDEDLAAGRYQPPQIHTRFPPEPNGYLHIGHAKSICLNFGLAEEHGGRFNLRFDDTNPAKEEQEYVDAIIDDVRWLGADWEDRLFYASDYFETLYDWAAQLIQAGHAYVCDLDADQMREARGTLTEPGADSPFRGRSVEENLDLFARMKAGEFPDGAKTLRAKIDMASPNVNLRDPVMYRIKHLHHQRTGDQWRIYPAYDWAHGQEDAIEGITHSICTLEFENHRPLYDWYLDRLAELGLLPHGRPRQIEFSKLQFTYIVLGKRKLLQMVQEGHVAGWDDPRMPTLRGLRRRGYTPEAVRNVCIRSGVTKFSSTIDLLWLEDAAREHLNEITPRRMAVLRPLKVVLTPQEPADAAGGDPLKQCQLDNHPKNPAFGARTVALGREIYIEQDDFMEEAPKKFFRLKPGGSVRLRGAGIATCREVVKDAAGRVTELRCSFNPDTTALVDGKKVKGTIHWVDAATAADAEVRLYDHLFRVEAPDKPLTEDGTFLDNLNPDSLETVTAKIEPALAQAAPGDRFQFERLGYFYADPTDSAPGAPRFNRTVTLRDAWGKAAGK